MYPFPQGVHQILEDWSTPERKRRTPSGRISSSDLWWEQMMGMNKAKEPSNSSWPTYYSFNGAALMLRFNIVSSLKPQSQLSQLSDILVICSDKDSNRHPRKIYLEDDCACAIVQLIKWKSRSLPSLKEYSDEDVNIR